MRIEKVSKKKTLKSSVINLELKSVEGELKKISEIKLTKYDEEKKEEKKMAKNYLTERRRVLRMLVQDNEPLKNIKNPEGKVSSFCAKETLCDFAQVIKTVENEDKNYGSRYRILLDLNTEDVEGVIKGKQIKKDSEDAINFDQNEKSTVKYRTKGTLNKRLKYKKPTDSQKKKKKKIEKLRNNRIKNRSNLLRETSESKESSEKVINLFKKISHLKRGDRHFENNRPKEKIEKMNEKTMLKIFKKYIPEELLEFEFPNEKSDLEYNIYTTPKEWLDEQIQLKINKIRTIKELLH